jgi:hypothetical protein
MTSKIGSAQISSEIRPNDKISGGAAHNFSALNTDLASCHPSIAQNFEATQILRELVGLSKN